MMMPSIFGENLFDDFMDDFPFYSDKDFKKLEKNLYGHHAKNQMKTDIKEEENGYELEMDLPGFRKEEIKVALEDGYLTIYAAKGLNKEQKEKKSGRYIRKERYVGTCQRSFYVGEGVKKEEIKGQFKHGILKLTIPKKELQDTSKEGNYIAIEG